jgi:hypothetical protein
MDGAVSSQRSAFSQLIELQDFWWMLMADSVNPKIGLFG